MMRKKIFNVVMATVLTVAMGVTAFAANSPTASGVVTANTGKDANGEEIYYTVEPVKAEYASAVAEIETVDGLKAALGSAYVDAMEVVDVRSIVLHEKEIATYAMEGGVAFPLTLTFSVPGVVKGTKVAILSYVNGIWQMLQCVAGDGTISAVFDSEAQFEAVAFVVDKNTTAGGGQTSGKDNQTKWHSNILIFQSSFIYRETEKSTARVEAVVMSPVPNHYCHTSSSGPQKTR